MDDAASADVPTPRLPRRRPLDGTAERRGAGDASKCGATSTAVPLGSRLVPSPQTDNSQTLDAVGLLPGSDNEQRCAAVDGTKEGGESLGAAVAAAALGARPGFVWQCGSSACLNPSSSNATTDGSRDGSAGGGSSGEENPERSHALAGRAGNSLFDDWTDLRGRRPRVAGGGSGTAPGKEALVKATEGRRPIFHQKAPSGRILQELFDLESGPLDLEFLVSLRTLSRSSSSSTRSSSARSSTYARDTPTATPSQPLASLVTASPAPAPAAASDGPALPGAASASASPGSEATTESAGAASAESHAPQSSALVPATPGAPARDEGIDNDSDAADDCSVDEEDEAAAAAASAWAAVELVDVSVSPAASDSRGWIASAARSRFISRIASSFNYSSLHSRRGLFGLRAKKGEIRHAFPLPPVLLPAATAATATPSPGAAVGGSPGSSGETSASVGHHNDISSAPSGQCLVGSRGFAPSSSIGVANSNSGSSAGMGSSSSSSRGVGKASMVAWKEPEPSIHDAAWRMLVLQQQKIATMEEEIMLLRQRSRVAGPASEKSRHGGGAVTAAGSSGCDALVSEEQGAVGASGAVYARLGEYSVISVHRGPREGAPARAESKIPPPPDPDLLDPCPDITALFRHYNDLYFQGRLGACLVECAGVCMYDGALCRIRLSAPLLQYRPVSDLKATLLHEMIHAFIFLCRPSHSREDHGPMFQGIMGTINTSTLHDHQISVYHSFKDEVNVHRRHAWQVPWVGRRGCRGVWGGCRGSGGGCGGVVRCQEEVRRAMNRPPSVADCMALRQPYTAEGRGGREQGGNGQGGKGQGGRGQGGNGGMMTAEEKERERQRRIATCRHPRCNWHLHARTCGGTFIKVAGPEDSGQGKAGRSKRTRMDKAGEQSGAAAGAGAIGSGSGSGAGAGAGGGSGSRKGHDSGNRKIEDFFAKPVLDGKGKAKK
ncbi:unnamed protein product [Closterium sp. NIES-64]|nr:unnamed protein product [Closterium sp. NIES-64]